MRRIALPSIILSLLMSGTVLATNAMPRVLSCAAFDDHTVVELYLYEGADEKKLGSAILIDRSVRLQPVAMLAAAKFSKEETIVSVEGLEVLRLLNKDRISSLLYRATYQAKEPNGLSLAKTLNCRVTHIR